MKRQKIIQVPFGNVDKMRRYYGCSRTTVYTSLAYKNNSELAKTIRRDAIAMFGGYETTKVIF
jgi:hypothetical protein